jgi:hypothetical protein
MCTVSMVMDHYGDRWQRRLEGPYPVAPFAPIPPAEPRITDEEVREFRDLLERARKYDREHGQPDCELEEKKQRLRALAKELGVEIAFP